MGIVHFLWVQESLLKVERVPVCPRALEFWVGITGKERARLHVHSGSTVHPLITEMAARIFCTTLTMVTVIQRGNPLQSDKWLWFQNLYQNGTKD